MQDPSTDEEVETKPRVSYKSVKKYRRAMKGRHRPGKQLNAASGATSEWSKSRCKGGLGVG